MPLPYEIPRERMTCIRFSMELTGKSYQEAASDWKALNSGQAIDTQSIHRLGNWKCCESDV